VRINETRYPKTWREAKVTIHTRKIEELDPGDLRELNMLNRQLEQKTINFVKWGKYTSAAEQDAADIRKLQRRIDNLKTEMSVKRSTTYKTITATGLPSGELKKAFVRIRNKPFNDGNRENIKYEMRVSGTSEREILTPQSVEEDYKNPPLDLNQEPFVKLLKKKGIQVRTEYDAHDVVPQLKNDEYGLLLIRNYGYENVDGYDDCVGCITFSSAFLLPFTHYSHSRNDLYVFNKEINKYQLISSCSTSTDRKVWLLNLLRPWRWGGEKDFAISDGALLVPFANKR
jgi:hypothetical protein